MGLQHSLSLTPDEALLVLIELAGDLVERHENRRVALGIVGGPGVGKSTVAGKLVARLNDEMPRIAVLVPMDGFHMRHQELAARGIDADKGMPHTFDGAAFADFIATAKGATDPLSGPAYSRQIEDVVEDAFTIAPEASLLVVEGNYLLLDTPPWDRVRQLLETTVFIGVPRETVRARLMKRHAAEGLFTDERNRAHIERVDLANYDLVEGSRARADLSIDLITES